MILYQQKFNEKCKNADIQRLFKNVADFEKYIPTIFDKKIKKFRKSIDFEICVWYYKEVPSNRRKNI